MAQSLAGRSARTVTVGRNPSDPNAERRAEIEDVFDEALEMPTERRPVWLAERCGSDHELRHEVELLLAAHEQEDSLLDSPAAGRVASLLNETSSGRRIGPYRVLRELGRGGMGVVYLAERDDGQYRRRVAVKVLRASEDADELHQRFLAERQILASLNHAHIAQLLDGGVSDGQLPYLVIEYVDGLPITEYCDRQKLGTRARLALFREVCAAVQHAHQNLVLHRDLKPGNVLVTSTSVVKLLDFGIAKLLNPSLVGVDQPITRTSYRLMTPAYASPEQVRGDVLTTASDVYALGLLLFELLAGRPAHRLTTDSPREVYEVVCERDPGRASDIPDLDAIVAMALRKEPGRRYGSAELLAEDVGRYLDGLPVLAHRGSRWYRFEKLVRRHRAAATIAAVGTIVLTGAAAISLRLASVATRERDRGAAALAQTQRALDESEAVTAFLVGLFEASDPAEGGQDGLTARDLLRRGATRVERLDAEPTAQSRMLDALGRVYASRNDLELGATLLRRALDVRQKALGANDPRTATTTAALADVYRRQGKYAAADTLAREALRVRRAAFGNAHADVAASLQQLSSIAIYRGNFTDAENYQLVAVAAQRQLNSPDNAGLVLALETLAAIFWRRGDDAAAERTLREALAVAQQDLTKPHRERAGAMMRLAAQLDRREAGRAEAESLMYGAVRESRSTFGEVHPNTAESMKQLGLMVANHGRIAEGERLVRQALDMQRRTYGPSHTAVGETTVALAKLLAQRGYQPEAEQLARDGVRIYGASLGVEHSTYAGSLGDLADIVVLRGALDSAAALRRRALAIRNRSSGPEHTLTALTAVELADVLTRQRRFAEADSIYRASLAILRRHTTDTHVDVRRTYASLATLYDAWGHRDSAAVFRRLAAPPEAASGRNR